MVTLPRWQPCPYEVKTLKISSTLEPKGQWPWDLVYSIGMLALLGFTNVESRLTLIFFTVGPNLIPNAFILGKP